MIGGGAVRPFFCADFFCGSRSPNRDEASHQRGRDREGGRGGERKEGAGKYQRPPGSDLLHEVAGTMNKFAGDGSFLDSFQAGHTSAQVEKRPQEEEAYSVPGRYSPSQEERRKLEEPAPSAPALEHAGKEGGGEAAKAPASSNTSVAEALRNRLRGSATAGDTSGVAATGNKSVADALRARLAGKVHNAAPSAEQRVERVVLPMVDSQGRAAPGAFGRKTAGADAVPEGNRIPKAVQR